MEELDIHDVIAELELIRDLADRLIDEVVRSAEQLTEHSSGCATG